MKRSTEETQGAKLGFMRRARLITGVAEMAVGAVTAVGASAAVALEMATDMSVFDFTPRTNAELVVGAIACAIALSDGAHRISRMPAVQS